MWLPIGLGWTSLEPIGWPLRPGEHLLVAGPARSGRTTALCTAASVLGRLRPDWPVIAVGARQPLPSDAVASHVGPHDLSELAALLGSEHRDRPTVLLVDDADLLDDPSGVLATLLAAPRPDLLVVAAGRNDGLRGQYGTWLRRVRMSRAGLLLQPDADLDGDLLGVPAAAPAARPFRSRPRLPGGGRLGRDRAGRAAGLIPRRCPIDMIF